MTPAQDAAALADRIKKHLSVCTKLGLDTVGLFEEAATALRATSQTPDAVRAFDTTGTTLQRSCNVFTITCTDCDTANRVADQLRSTPSASAGLQAEAAVESRITRLTEALKSISANTCCDNCREAALVARSAIIAAYVGLAREPQPQQADDPLEKLVNGFAKRLLAKLRLSRANGRSGWERDDWEKECQQGLLRHVAKGDPRDVAAYCAFLWHHGWITVPAPQQADGREAVIEALDLLQLQQRGRAKAFRILDQARAVSDPATLAQADAYEECGNELRAALQQSPATDNAPETK